MKKIFVIISLSLLIAAAFTSCKSPERCPAYGKADIDNTEKSV